MMTAFDNAEKLLKWIKKEIVYYYINIYNYFWI